MQLLSLAIKIYPFWAVPVAFILFEIGFFYKRRKSDLRYAFFGGTTFFVITALVWVVMRGDVNAEAWIRSLAGH